MLAIQINSATTARGLAELATEARFCTWRFKNFAWKHVFAGKEGAGRSNAAGALSPLCNCLRYESENVCCASGFLSKLMSGYTFTSMSELSLSW